jgi:hypothetical protein
MEGIKVKRIVQYIIPVLLASFVCGAGICWAISSITATGNWLDLTIGASNLTGGAGSNLNDGTDGTYQSAANAVQLNITATGNWKVQVEKTDSTLPGSLQLNIRKTSAPAGSYQEVTDFPKDFLGVSGTGDTTVNVQFELTGVSIQVPPNVYSATIQYTVSDQ